MKNWYISNNKNKNSFNTGRISIETTDPLVTIDDLSIYLEGYILPRYSIFKKYKHLSSYELIAILFTLYEINFLNYIKGTFNLILIHHNKIYIANDFHSLRKFFYFISKDNIHISNNIERITAYTKPKVNNNSVVLYELLEHFTCEQTLFEGIRYSGPARLIEINTESLEVNKTFYYDIEASIKPNTSDITIEEFSDFWKTLISNYIEYLKPRSTSLTLTGGNDSRMILSAMIKQGIKPNLFSFGNPSSFDAQVARKISNFLQYDYNNYYESPTENWYTDHVDEVIRIGNSLVNLHRAHRLFAIDSELENNPQTDMLFCGFMGGDYVKGLSYDDYITPRLFREYEYGNSKRNIPKAVENILCNKFIDDNLFDIEFVNKLLEESNFFSSSELKIREFNRLFYLVGCSHDYQDITVFNSRIPFVVNPFMDIDFLERLYGSRFSFLSVNSNLFFKKFRIGRSNFHLEITHQLAPKLSNIEYAKKGYYTANEYLNTNPYLLNIKRYYRLKKQRQFPPSFPYDYWFKQYLHKNLQLLHTIEGLPYKTSSLIQSLKDRTTIPQNEGALHLYSNPINIALNIKNLNT